LANEEVIAAAWSFFRELEETAYKEGIAAMGHRGLVR